MERQKGNRFAQNRPRAERKEICRPLQHGGLFSAASAVGLHVYSPALSPPSLFSRRSACRNFEEVLTGSCETDWLGFARARVCSATTSMRCMRPILKPLLMENMHLAMGSVMESMRQKRKSAVGSGNCRPSRRRWRRMRDLQGGGSWKQNTLNVGRTEPRGFERKPSEQAKQGPHDSSVEGCSNPIPGNDSTCTVSSPRLPPPKGWHRISRTVAWKATNANSHYVHKTMAHVRGRVRSHIRQSLHSRRAQDGRAVATQHGVTRGGRSVRTLRTEPHTTHQHGRNGWTERTQAPGAGLNVRSLPWGRCTCFASRTSFTVPPNKHRARHRCIALPGGVEQRNAERARARALREGSHRLRPQSKAERTFGANGVPHASTEPRAGECQLPNREMSAADFFKRATTNCRASTGARVGVKKNHAPKPVEPEPEQQPLHPPQSYRAQSQTQGDSGPAMTAQLSRRQLRYCHMLNGNVSYAARRIEMPPDSDEDRMHEVL